MPAPGPVVTTREAGSVDEIDAAFWPLLAMAGLAVQLRRRRAQGAVRSTGDTHAARVAEHEEEPDPLPF